MSSILQAARNARDLGGHEGRDGRRTKENAFIRSDAPRERMARDGETLRSRGVTVVIDLRTEAEAAGHPSAFADIQGISYLHCPIAEGSEAPESPDEVPASYLRIAGAAQMPRIFRALAQAPGGALFHCTAGKDRTGVVAAILLLLAGVDDGEIAADYAVSRENNRERLAAYLSAHPEVNPEAVLAREDNMLAFLRLFREKWGTAEGYLAALGLDGEDIRRLREKLL